MNALVEKVVELPKEIEMEVKRNRVKMKLHGKEIERKFKVKHISIEKKDSSVLIKADSDKKSVLSIMNTISSDLDNMANGLKFGYECKAEIVYSHFPMNIAVKDVVVEINNLAGAKQAKKAQIVGLTTVQVKGKEITIKGPDKQAVGQTAANLEQATKIKNKDVRVFQDGIYIISKPKLVMQAADGEKSA